MKNKRLLTLLIGICLVLVLVSLPFMAACAKPAPAPTPTPAPMPAPAPTSVEPIKLRYAQTYPPVTQFFKKIDKPWTEKIMERTTAIGKPVKVTLYPGCALGKEADHYSFIVSGIADVSQYNRGTTPGRFPLSEVWNMPFLFPSSTVAAQVWHELFETRPDIGDEYAEAKLMWFQPAPLHHLLSRTKQVKTLEDLKGLRIWSDGEYKSETLKALGAVPVPVPVPEVYIALERGILDAAMWSVEAFFAWKVYEIAKYRTIFPQGVTMGQLGVSMNWDTWNSLPPDVQEIFEELSGRDYSKLCGETADAANMEAFGLIEEYDKKVGNPGLYYLSENEFQRCVEATAPVYDKWIADMEAKGLPGRAVLEDTQRLIEKYSK